MPTTKQIRNSSSMKKEIRRNRKENIRVAREGKIHKVRKDLGLPHFGHEKEQLERKNQQLKERIQKQAENTKSVSMEQLIENAKQNQRKFIEERKTEKEEFSTQYAKERNAAVQTRRAFFHQLKEVITRSDVIIIVLDARDPVGCRSKLIEKKILEKDKRIILLINKIDLVPKQVAMMWLSLLRQEYPTILFKASTQSQRNNLGRNDMDIRKANASVMSSNVCLGADNVLQLLKNYCRTNGVKTAITVGIIGYPNVGKSSLINSLKRSRAVGVSSTAGYTRAVQEIQIDRNISLLDCPGIIFNNNNNSYLLRNCVDVKDLDDPEGVVEKMMMTLNKNTEYLKKYYAIPSFSTIQELLAYIARSRGKLKKGGVPDIRAAACIIINDFNQGMIPFYVKPPRALLQKTNEGLQIVNEWSSAFDASHLDNENMQIMQAVDNAFEDDKYMVLDAAEEEEVDLDDEYDIPVLERHFANRYEEIQPRIKSKEEILQEREEMLQKEMLQEEENNEDAVADMEEEDGYDFTTGFIQ